MSPHWSGSHGRAFPIARRWPMMGGPRTYWMRWTDADPTSGDRNVGRRPRRRSPSLPHQGGRRQRFLEDLDATDHGDEGARIDVGRGGRRRKTGKAPKPDRVSEERREEREEQDRQPATDPHRREVSDELGKGERDERKQEDGPDQEGPGDQGGRRISNERSLTEDRIEGGKDGRRDDGQRSLGGLEPELASRVGEGDHQAESAKREGDGRGLEGADLLLEERDRQHRDERRSRGDDERRGPRGHRRVGFTEVPKEVVSGEADKREEGQPGKVRPTRGGPELAPRRKGTDEQQVGNPEAQERQGDPRHVPEGLLDRDEREPPDQDEEEHGAVDGPARAEPVRQRHAAGTWAGDKKVRAAIAGTRIGN